MATAGNRSHTKFEYFLQGHCEFRRTRLVIDAGRRAGKARSTSSLAWYRGIVRNLDVGIRLAYSNGGVGGTQLVLINRSKRPLWLLACEIGKRGKHDPHYRQGKAGCAGSGKPRRWKCVLRGAWERSSSGANCTERRPSFNPSVREHAVSAGSDSRMERGAKRTTAEVICRGSIGLEVGRKFRAAPLAESTHFTKHSGRFAEESYNKIYKSRNVTVPRGTRMDELQTTIPRGRLPAD